MVDVEPADSLLAGNRLRVLLFFPALIMTFIISMYFLYTWFRPGRASLAKRRPRPAAFNVITSSSSLLDTHGNTLTPWAGYTAHAPKISASEHTNDPEGWFNLVLVSLNFIMSTGQEEINRLTQRLRLNPSTLAGADSLLCRHCRLL